MTLFSKKLPLQSDRNLTNSCLRSIGAVIILLMLSPQLKAQNKLAEIHTKIENTKNDSIKAETYIDLAYEYFFFSLDSSDQALRALDKSAEIANKAGYRLTLIETKNVRSRIYREKGNYKRAEKIMREAIALAKEGKLKKTQHQLEDNLANSLFDQGRADEALALKISALKAFTEMGDSNSASVALFGIGYIYLELEQLQKAKESFFNSEKMASNQISNIEVYGNLGIIYSKLDRLDSAEYYLQKAAIKGKDYPSFYFANQVNLAEVIYKKGNIQKALTMLLDIKDEYRENTEERDYQYYFLRIAEYYTELNNWEKAQEYLQGIDTSIVLNRNQFKKTYGYVGHQLQLKRKDYKEALRYYTIYRDAIDSMENARIDSNFKEIESKYELSEKQATISNQKLKIRDYSLGFVSVLGLLLLGGLLFIGYQRKTVFNKKIIQEKTEKQKIEIDNLRKENKIISMQSMIEGQEEERKRIARDLHDNIGTLMSSIKMRVLSIQREVQDLENMNITTELDSMIDNASQQVRRISYSMTPVALDISGLAPAIKDLGLQLTQNNIELHANIDVLNEVDDKKMSINIYRILQELIQNIIKHSRASEVSIDIAKKENDLIMRIRDNGIGLKEAQWEDAKSIGANNIKSRVNYLNGEIKLIADIGTHFKITIPLS